MDFKLALAHLTVAADAMSEASYVPGDDDSYGYYSVTKRDAAEAIVERDGLDPDLLVPAQLLLYWVNDSLSWARRVIAEAELATAKEEGGYQAELAMANALANEALGLPG